MPRLCAALGVIHDGSVRIGGDDHARNGQHAHCGHRDAVGAGDAELLRQEPGRGHRNTDTDERGHDAQQTIGKAIQDHDSWTRQS